MSEPHFLYEKRGHVAICTFNRPEKKNALTIEMLCRMADAWTEADADDEVRAIVLHGKGDCFFAGSDLGAMSTGKWDAADEWLNRMKEDPDLHWKALLRHYKTKKPLIAAVEGAAVAGGTEVLQGTDIRVAGESAFFAVSEVKWGLFPLGGSSVRLRRQIPYAIAAEMLLTGRTLKSHEALQWGLINHVVPDGEAFDKAMQIAERIAHKCGPVAVQALKKSLIETEGLVETEALKISMGIGQPVFKTKDAKEGPTAFMEKRPPKFIGA
jgi:enoyl-CoA hydratase